MEAQEIQDVSNVQELNAALMTEEVLNKTLNEEPIETELTEEAKAEAEAKAKKAAEAGEPEIFSKEQYDLVVAEGEKLKERITNQEKMKYDVELQKTVIAQQGKGNMPGM